MSILLATLIADAGDIVGVIVMIVFILIGVLAKAFEGMKNNPGAPPARREPPPRPGPAQQPFGGNRAPQRPGQPAPAPLAQMADMNGGRELEARPAAMGSDIGRETNEMRRQMHEVFDHDVASIREQDVQVASIVDPGATAEIILDDDDAEAPSGRRESVSPMAAELFGMLQSPSGVRQAILLSEVLQRPEHRWER